VGEGEGKEREKKSDREQQREREAGGVTRASGCVRAHAGKGWPRGRRSQKREL
jgi:hypothetical protein